MRKRLVLLAALALAGPAVSRQAAPAPATPAKAPLEQKPQRLPGYLAADAVPDGSRYLPPAPAPGSLTQTRDEAVFRETRALQGTPRWALAQRDAVESVAAIMGDFGCALGVRLTPKTAPALTHLITRLGPDMGAIVNKAKQTWKRPRPFIGNDLPICVERTEGLARSPSYPSGHTTAGWALGLVLAQMAPDRATEILARARAFGESRVVCGVHFVSDIDEGRANGSALVAAEQANPAFRADFEAAQAELAKLRAGGGPTPDAAECRIEDDAAAHTPWRQ